MLKHIVFINFKAEATEEQIVDMEKGLGALPSIIGEIKEYVFGRDVLHSERSYNFALVSAFEDMDAMQRYQVHPAHQEVLAKVKAVAGNIVVVDFTY